MGLGRLGCPMFGNYECPRQMQQLKIAPSSFNSKG